MRRAASLGERCPQGRRAGLGPHELVEVREEVLARNPSASGSLHDGMRAGTGSRRKPLLWIQRPGAASAGSSAACNARQAAVSCSA
jgi:hypothetical protein